MHSLRSKTSQEGARFIVALESVSQNEEQGYEEQREQQDGDKGGKEGG